MNKSKYWSYGIITLAIVGVIFISGCTQQQIKYVCPDGITVSDSSLCLKQTYTCSDGTEVNNKADCQKMYCNIINKPSVDLRCRSKSGNTYEYCTIYIIPDSRDGGEVNYLMYESRSGTNKKEQVTAHYQFPFDTPTGGPAQPDEYNYYFKGLTPNDESDMFIIIPYDVNNKQHCENLKVNLFFSDAKIVS